MTEQSKPVLRRREVVARILRDRKDALAICSLGNPTFDLASAGDCPQNFYLWGAMGGAVMAGMGIALAQPEKRVFVFVGDGEMMMGLGSLATVACHGPKNLSIVVIDNEHYAETGMQAAHAGRGVSITAVATAVGFTASQLVRTQAQLEDYIDTLYNHDGPALIGVKVTTDPEPTCLPPRDGPFLRSRFREALMGAEAHR
ncbi:aldehyde dehydrogenase [Pseudomonas tolaasii]|uniref:thiamine pyrophosphate-dependent enzyme n=1 Tax=Pseudomonas tolaasii TaxID=29442 RepID=UPI00159F8E80|nr:thiamine pyrophosphate-dependent enzyme [Pseudomonas tolaasii]NVZ48667.1 aldehyde dehydrogenase [Pseudomonas tolaasii]NWA52696.1 aldehyde dehydrogenase [Pseudomonas tolaasii]